MVQFLLDPQEALSSKVGTLFFTQVNASSNLVSVTRIEKMSMLSANKRILRGIGLILLVIAILTCIPLLAVWAINTLFVTHIAYSISTWFAAVVLMTLWVFKIEYRE